MEQLFLRLPGLSGDAELAGESAPSGSQVIKGDVERLMTTPGSSGIDGELTRRARELARSLGLQELSSRIRVEWNPRLRTTAGTANAKNWQIDLNCQLQGFGAAERIRILKHELAHLIAHHRAGRRRIAAHGAEWRKACADLGIPGEKRCHTLPLKGRRAVRRKYAYRCPRCRDVIERVRRLARHAACWGCCKRLNRGRYSAKFEFEQISMAEAACARASSEASVDR